MTRHDRQSRWYAKLLADPVRLAVFRAKTRTASLRHYHATVKPDAARLAARRKAGRESMARKRRGAETPVRSRMSDEQYRAKRRAWSAAWRASQRQHVRDYQNAWRQAHLEQARAHDKRRYQQKQAYKAEHYRRFPGPVRARVAKWQKANPDKVRDYPVRVNLARQIGCATKDVPVALMRLIRAHLDLKRELRQAA